MSWLNPPIEKVIESAGNKYILCSVISKRAKELLLNNPDYFKVNQRVKPVEFASKEFYEGVFTVTNKPKD